MKVFLRIVFVFVALLTAGTSVNAQSLNILPKRYLVKFDPVSSIFNEFRMTYDRRLVIEQRERVKDKKKIFGGNYLYFSPFVLNKRVLGKHPSPDTLSERHVGIGIRTGVRHFLFSDKDAEGFFLILGLSYRLRKIKFTGPSPEFTGRTFTHSPGALGAFGYQMRTSPKKNIAFSGAAGVEYMYNVYASGFSKSDFHRSWYQFAFLDEFRVYLSIEVGFAFRQKNRHW